MCMRPGILHKSRSQTVLLPRLFQISIVSGVAVGTLLLLSLPGMATPEGAEQANPDATTATRRVRFETDILPIFKSSCVQCHSPQSKAKGLDCNACERDERQ